MNVLNDVIAAATDRCPPSRDIDTDSNRCREITIPKLHAFTNANDPEPLIPQASETTEPPSSPQTGIPFLITSAMKVTLHSMGYTDEDIIHMRPANAHQIITNGWTKAPTH
jgi:hypothetical protein